MAVLRKLSSLVTGALVVGFFLLVSAWAFGLLGNAQNGAGKSAKAGPAAAIPVEVVPIKLQPVQRVVNVVGSFTGLDELNVAPKVAGRVVKLFHDVGDVVRPGDKLVDIERIDYELARTEMQRSLEAELAKLGLTQLPEGEFDVNNLPTVVRALNVEKNAKQRLVRAEKLRQDNSISVEDYEQCATDHLVAQALRQQAILDARGTLASARYKASTLATADQRLIDTSVVAPLPTASTTQDPEHVEYVIAERMVSEGEMVRGNTLTVNPVFRLVIDRVLKLRALVPEHYVGDVRVGLSAEIQVDAYPGEKFPGKVVRVSPIVDRVSRTFQIEVQVPNAQRRLRPGGFAKVAVLTKTDPNARTVPVESLITFVGSSKIFVVRADKAKAIAVQPVTELPPDANGIRWVEVAGKVLPDDRVVVNGQRLLSDDVPVAIRDATLASETK